MYNVVYEEFPNISNLLNELKRRPVNDIWAGGADRSSGTGSRKFTGTSSYEEAEQLAINGWDEHLDEMKTRLNDFTIKASVNTPVDRIRPENRVVGFAPHVPNAILGLPQSMINIQRTPQKTKAITIIYNTSVTANVTTQEVLDSGIAVLQLVNNIELNGVRVKLVSEFKSSKEDDDLGIARVVIKDFKDHLDLKKIAFPFAHASMQRRLGFAWLETVQGLKCRYWKGSYGSSLNNIWGYEQITSTLKKHNLLNDNEFYITTKLCKECRYNVNELAKRLDIKL